MESKVGPCLFKSSGLISLSVTPDPRSPVAKSASLSTTAYPVTVLVALMNLCWFLGSVRSFGSVGPCPLICFGNHSFGISSLWQSAATYPDVYLKILTYGLYLAYLALPAVCTSLLKVLILRA